ncbi:hypothetical protein BpHYR1_024347 [Brachionus plicatilis]|uniref:Uncharacterized protein n=1 Tax=Brachionus plicatilis TaxID=10195 RepID=A0A3M7RZA5_BRAPC|nr:hypothetical protein BpHYR1_024347 [Brachionus plicatilis]
MSLIRMLNELIKSFLQIRLLLKHGPPCFNKSEEKSKLLNHPNAKLIFNLAPQFSSLFQKKFEIILRIKAKLTQILTSFQEEWYRVFAKTLSDCSYRPNIY